MTADRNLPKRFYGWFDIVPTTDGGKEYSLPHTLKATALDAATRPLLIGALALLGLAADRVFGPVHTSWSGAILYPLLAFLGLHLVTVLALVLVFAATGFRRVTRIAIREDGLIWNRQHFFPADYLHQLSYGSTINAGKPDEEFTPKIEVDLGTTKLTLAEDLEPEAARLFERFFRDDLNRYFRRHN